MNRNFSKSLWVYHFTASSCMGCNTSIVDAVEAEGVLEKYGIVFVDSIRHADCILVTGIINFRNLAKLKVLCNQISKPFYIIALGNCSLNGGVFNDSYNNSGSLDKHMLTDVAISGCPPKPAMILMGLLELEKKIKIKKIIKRKRIITRVKKL